jgi:hypothetical protein
MLNCVLHEHQSLRVCPIGSVGIAIRIQSTKQIYLRLLHVVLERWTKVVCRQVPFPEHQQMFGTVPQWAAVAVWTQPTPLSGQKSGDGCLHDYNMNWFSFVHVGAVMALLPRPKYVTKLPVYSKNVLAKSRIRSLQRRRSWTLVQGQLYWSVFERCPARMSSPTLTKSFRACSPYRLAVPGLPHALQFILHCHLIMWRYVVFCR